MIDKIMKAHILWIFWMCQHPWPGSLGVSHPGSEQQVQAGQQEYAMMVTQSRMPRYGECWTRALSALEEGCEALTDEIQGRLALNFANCFLEKAGLQTYPCPGTTSIADCLKGVDSNAFTSYSNFFTHTQNMCYFLQSQVWQDETQKTIGSLSRTSAQVAAGLEHATQMQEKIVVNQQATLDYQREILANSSMLSEVIDMSKANVKDMLDAFKSSTDEQRSLIFEIFDRVSKLQNLVISEVSWIYTVVFYGTCLLAMYLSTASKRTADARLWLFGILSMNFALERIICKVLLPPEGFPSTEDVSEVIYEQIWLLRKCSLSICVGVLVYFAYKFKDYNALNFRLLEDIRKQNLELKEQMEMIQGLNRRANFDVTDHKSAELKSIDFPSTHLNQVEDETPNEDAEYSDDDSNEDTLSFISSQTDRTWMSDVTVRGEESDIDDEEDGDDFVDESFLSFTIPNPGDMNLLMPMSAPEPVISSNSSRCTTPLSSVANSAQNVSIESVSSVVAPEVSKAAEEVPSPAAKKRGRPRKTSLSSVNSSVNRSLNVSQHSYNLRRRKSILTDHDNPILDAESPNSFGKLVNKMANIARRNSEKVRMAVNKEKMLADSSDENQ